MVEDNIIQDFVNTIKSDQQENTKTYLATVSRVESDGSVFVRLAGSDIETPIAMTSAEVSRGDIVNVEWRNNKLYIAGNSTSPSVGVVRVEAVEAATQVANEAAANAVQSAGEAHAAAEDAKATAEGVHDIAVQASEDAASAQESAENASEYAARALGNLSTVQSVTETLNWITAHGTMTLTSDVALDPTHIYFVVDAGGDYVVGGTHYAVVTEPDVADIATYYELSIDESLNNYVGTHLAVTSEGLWLIPESGTTPANSGKKILIATGAGSTYTTAGTYIIEKVGGVDTVLAEFTANGAVIGDAAGAHTVIDDDGMQIYSVDSNDNLVELANIGYGQGASESGTAVAPYYTFGVRRPGFSVGNYSVAEGHTNVASGVISHAEGRFTEASGVCSHAEGSFTKASDYYDHAEGFDTEASGTNSHAEGYNTTASGVASHAEGIDTFATGYYTHSEGRKTTASGDYSHSQNNYTIAQRKSQTALGEYNIADTTGADGTVRGSYAVIVGNGTADNARSNAATLDWSGNLVTAGNITDGTGNVLSDKIGEDANGDVSITRNITAGGNVEAAGDVTDGAGTSIADLSKDYIIENGKNSNWMWRKWKSGKIEAWGAQAYSAATSTLWANNTYYRDLSVSIPSGIFTSAPTEIYATSGNDQYWVAGTKNVTDTSFTVRLIRPNNASNSAIVRVYAVYWAI